MITGTRAELEALEQKDQSLQLVAAYAKDVVDFWSQFSIRQIPVMAAKIKALKEALELANK